MLKPENYDQTTAATGEGFKQLPPGAYVCKIMGARMELTRSGKEVLVLAFDIIEGEHKNFYTEIYDRKVIANKDTKWPGTYRQLTQGNSTQFFKGMITAIEKSNSGYSLENANWDETTMKGKVFGGIFGEEEFLAQDGKVKTTTRLQWVRSIESIKGDVTIPSIKKLKRDEVSSAFGGHDVPNADEEIPF